MRLAFSKSLDANGGSSDFIRKPFSLWKRKTFFSFVTQPWNTVNVLSIAKSEYDV